MVLRYYISYKYPIECYYLEEFKQESFVQFTNIITINNVSICYLRFSIGIKRNEWRYTCSVIQLSPQIMSGKRWGRCNQVFNNIRQISL